MTYHNARLTYVTAKLLAVGILAASSAAQAERFGSAHAHGTCITNAGGSAKLEGCSTSNSAQNIDMPWIAKENVFFGQFKVGGQCLTSSGKGNALTFAGCKSGDKAQVWKLTGSNGVLNNGQNWCADVKGESRSAGASIIAWDCKGSSNQKWWNQTGNKVKIIAVPNMKSVAVGTPLTVDNGNIVAGGAGNIVAAGAAKIVAGGAGNIVAGGAGNIVAGGAGN